MERGEYDTVELEPHVWRAMCTRARPSAVLATPPTGWEKWSTAACRGEGAGELSGVEIVASRLLVFES